MRRSVQQKCVVALICMCVLYIWFNAASFFSKSQRASTQSVQDVVHRAPPMGWNSWNYFRCAGLNEDVVKGIADALLKTGLAAAGYVYVNLDDCWQVDRNASGYIVEDPQKFPSGMKALGEYLHTRGLRFGIYTDMGSLTCGKRPGSLHHEEKDVLTYNNWEVDYIKNDDCWVYPNRTAEQLYARFTKALSAISRPMIQSIKCTVPIKSAPKYAQVRRVGRDVFEEWGSIIYQVDQVVKQKLWESGRPGFWHDLDMLEVGVGHMTLDENVGHMILWCAFKSPLLLGNDIRSMSPSTLSVLAHDELIAINQDPVGRSVKLVWQGHPKDGLAGERVVTASCNVNDPRQQWIYHDQRLESMARKGQCVGAKTGVEGRLLAVLKDCDKHDKMQKWRLNKSSGQIELLGMPDKCLTTNTDAGIPALIRGCTERQSNPHLRGPNKGSLYYNDAFELIEATGSNSGFVIKNNRRRCPSSIGDHEELQVFTGPLSFNRQVAVLLNRDEIQHEITLRREHFHGLPHGEPVYLRDVYLRKDLGELPDEGYRSSLRGHQAQMIVADLRDTRTETEM